MNRIVSLQGVQFPPGLNMLMLVSLRGAAAAVGSVFFVLFCAAGLEGAARVAAVVCA